MEREQRNALRRSVESARRLLEREIGDQLEGLFNILPSGEVLQGGPGDPVVREKLLEVIAHHRAGGAKPAEAVERLRRESAFTVLNRFSALKMGERRGLVRECISRGAESDGIHELADVAPGLSAASPDRGYRLLLECLMDELSLGLKVLFDRRSPTGLIWPRPVALEQLLEILNDPELEGSWEQDETIGWIYQYFNSQEERREMREAGAPRNSRELAVRNQFFTPRYVVEFLTDNTLGRTWYEMRQGQTRLREQCRYLVYRPGEVFLAEGQTPPASDAEDAESRTIHILFRPKKDPRDLKVLDPACGSGHFLLYAFDLLQTIYEEAWLDPDLGPSLWEAAGFRPEIDTAPDASLADPRSVTLDPTQAPSCMRCGTSTRLEDALLVLADQQAPWRSGRPLVYCSACADEQQQDHLAHSLPLRDFSYEQALAQGWFGSATGTELLEMAGVFRFSTGGPREGMFEEVQRAADDDALGLLRQAIPGWILERNLYGIDIDPRAVQIAALALWMRAQRAYNTLHVPQDRRPAIARTNLVTAEPMPGEKEMVKEVIEDLRPRLLGQVVEKVFDQMRLAGEAGSLLRIEDEIRTALTEAKRAWLGADRQEKLALLDAPAEASGPQLSGITDERFWQSAEERIYDQLGRYASAAAESGYGRRLFAQDAAEGFAFIDVCRQHYDVVLMNPPFGDPSKRSKTYITRSYPRTKNDLYAAFVERGIRWLHPRGLLGAITSRTGFFLTSFRRWREEVVLGAARPTVVADLGYGVLDTAMVEVAAYCLAKTPDR